MSDAGLRAAISCRAVARRSSRKGALVTRAAAFLVLVPTGDLPGTFQRSLFHPDTVHLFLIQCSCVVVFSGQYLLFYGFAIGMPMWWCTRRGGQMDVRTKCMSA